MLQLSFTVKLHLTFHQVEGRGYNWIFGELFLQLTETATQCRLHAHLRETDWSELWNQRAGDANTLQPSGVRG